MSLSSLVISSRIMDQGREGEEGKGSASTTQLVRHLARVRSRASKKTSLQIFPVFLGGSGAVLLLSLLCAPPVSSLSLCGLWLVSPPSPKSPSSPPHRQLSCRVVTTAAGEREADRRVVDWPTDFNNTTTLHHTTAPPHTPPHLPLPLFSLSSTKQQQQ